MKIAYFTNQYPKASHSFIRREILALEKLGHSIERFALRCDTNQVVDETDKQEQRKTKYLLQTPRLILLKNFIVTFLSSPVLFVKILLLSIRLGLRSDRGVLRHLIYFVESCVLLCWQKNHDIDHTHAHFGTNSTTVVMLAKLLGGSDYSFTVHGPEEFDKPDFIHLDKKIIHSSFVVAITSFCKSQMFRLVESEHWSKIKIIHCGLDDVFLDDIDTDTSNSNQLVCVGRLCEQKGQLLLVEAFNQVIKAGHEGKLILAGDGEMREVVEQKIASLGIKEHVEITGWISSEQVKELLLASRTMVLPSFAEGLPVVIMEALALKKPVISTYIAGIPELVKSNENGWLVPAGDIIALTETIQLALTADEQTIKKMGMNGRKAVLAHHNVMTEASKLAELFEGK